MVQAQGIPPPSNWKKVISGGWEGFEKSHLFFPRYFLTSYLYLWLLLRIK